MALRRLLFLMTIIVLTTAAALKESGKTNDGAAELKDVFEDDNKRNLSDEVVMFGNQQNKAAGMIDDALVQGLKEGDDTSNEHNSDPSKNEAFHNKEKRVPIVSESGIEHETSSKSKESSQESNEDDDENFKMFNDYLSSASSEDDDPEMNNQDLTYDDIMLGLGNNQGWPHYSDLLENHYRRYRRNTINHQRDIRSSLDQLLNGDGTGRSKRDLHFTDEDILNLLEYMPYEHPLQDINMEKESLMNNFPEESLLAQEYENSAVENPQWDLYKKILMDNVEADNSDENVENQDWPFLDLPPHYQSQSSNVYPFMDYGDASETNDEQPLWEPLQERFVKRRLQQSSEEDEENSPSINENQSEVWPNGEDLNELYQRLIW